MARQRLGQHFLHDVGWREQIARAIRVSRHSQQYSGTDVKPFCWIEIGAGHGEMTEYLAATGAPVYAIELDASLGAGLQRFAKRLPNVSVISADILESDIAALTGGRRARIYGNLPYYITSPILHHLCARVDTTDQSHSVLQTTVPMTV